MNLRDIDLNLLVVFNQLLVERRVSKVAEKLGLTQPAVSNALARLRKLLGDELFLRTPRGMQPTPFADELAEPVAYALGMIHGALNQRSSFEPATSQRSFTIGMTDIGEIYFLPKLMDELARLAPGVSVSTVRNAAVNLKDEMEAGHVDLALGLLPQLKGGFFQRRLFRQREQRLVGEVRDAGEAGDRRHCGAPAGRNHRAAEGQRAAAGRDRRRPGEARLAEVDVDAGRGQSGG